ncbi:hypothetical protein CARUB_v10023505mg [Capsella rubella]|uniref:NYN domain-containing protein n=2 Tax=Capsella rubella TaxID=81985 RepID=R0FV02_9BRAS|nr:hypothetical protein CARUB_v10023505mg [Capsella rubella]
MGYYGCHREINAYSEKEISEDLAGELINEASINYNPGGSGYPMICNMILLVAAHAPKPQNVMVISKKFLQDEESLRVLCVLKSRGCNVLVVQPHNEAASGKLFHTPDLIFDSTRFLNGDNPMDQIDANGGNPMDQIVDDTSSSTSWETDSNPYTDVETDPDPDVETDADHDADLDADPAADPDVETDDDPDADLVYGGCKTGVFWDFDDSPFPIGLDPPSIYQNFKSALEARRYYGEMSIWAYAEEIPFPNDLVDEYRKARIYFITGGDKNTRFNRMIHDILLWELATPWQICWESNVIVISKNITVDYDFIRCLSNSEARGYNALFVEPNDRDNPETSEWPGYLLDGAKSIFDSSYH